jgi:hypothetical protein
LSESAVRCFDISSIINAVSRSETFSTRVRL